jgi:AcrR family transcriptional regulator
MADLAARVGLRKASLFHHFATKEELRQAVIARVITRIKAAVAATVDAELAAGGTAVDAMTDRVVATLGADPYAARLVLREAMAWDGTSQDSLCEAFAESLAASERFVAAAQKSGMCAQGDPKHIVATLMGLHLLPFALSAVMERFTGQAPCSDSFIATRRDAVRAHVRAILHL